MLNSSRQIDHNGGAPVLTEHGPAVLVPLAWLGPGQLARVCADRVVKRLGQAAEPNHVCQEAVRLMGVCHFHPKTAKRALERLTE